MGCFNTAAELQIACVNGGIRRHAKALQRAQRIPSDKGKYSWQINEGSVIIDSLRLLSWAMQVTAQVDARQNLDAIL